MARAGAGSQREASAQGRATADRRLVCTAVIIAAWRSAGASEVGGRLLKERSSVWIVSAKRWVSSELMRLRRFAGDERLPASKPVEILNLVNQDFMVVRSESYYVKRES